MLADNVGASVGSFLIIIVVCQKCDLHHSIRSSSSSSKDKGKIVIV